MVLLILQLNDKEIFLGSSTLLPISVQFLLAFELTQKFPIQASWLPVLDLLALGMDNSSVVEGQPAHLASLKSVAHVILLQVLLDYLTSSGLSGF